MKKTMYRISLYQREILTNELAAHAAAFNGGHTQFTIPTLKGIIDSNKAIYPILYGDYDAEVHNGTRLTISRKKGDSQQPLIEIQEVEIWEGEIVPPTIERHESGSGN